MSRLTFVFGLALALLSGASHAFAVNYAVGTCKPNLPSYGTIQMAVNSVPASSTILVCPGTYPEQVTVSQPLTLQGITSGGSSAAVITVPGSGLTPVATLNQGDIYPQIQVTSGPVTLTNLIFEGAGACASGNNATGVYYSSGSSGLMNEITTRNSSCQDEIGIFAENGPGTGQSITIQNSNVHDFSGTGIVGLSNQSPSTLTATIKNNHVYGGANGILQFLDSGDATGNVVTGAASVGIGSIAIPGTIANNTVADSGQAGLWAAAVGLIVTGNKVERNLEWGVFVGNADPYSGAVTIKSNTITESATAVEFNCVGGSVVSGNQIDEATIGLNDVPANFVGSNVYYGVVTIRVDGCAAGPALKNRLVVRLRAPR